MFDTIRMTADHIELDIEKIKKSGTKVEWNRYTYTIMNPRVPFFEYNPEQQKLTIQLSIPKFLYGNNVTLLKPEHINMFWEQLHDELLGTLLVSIQREEWIASRIDVCHNFDVGNQVSRFIVQIAKKSLPRKATCLYNQNQSVVFKNKSSRVTVYDKYKQMKAKGKNPQLTHQAFGILRLEIKCCKQQLRQYSSKRIASYFLNIEFCNRTLKLAEPLFTFIDIDYDDFISPDLLNSHSITMIERMLGFGLILEKLGEQATKELYSQSTFYKKIKALQPFLDQRRSALTMLSIPYYKAS
ncbi:phage/plasmid replication domain-containing protein [Paenibacillus marinisediminis]